MLPDSKACTKCGLDKPLADYSKNPRGKYGLKASCKACDAVRHAALTADRPRKDRRLPRRAPIDPTGPRDCTRCGATKTYADFSLSRQATATSNAVYRSHCKECQAEQARAWYANNPERANDNRRRHQLRSLYGLTVEQYNALLREQAGVCAVCGKGEPNAHGRTGKQFRLSVDHCHETGEVRGLLCQSCNRAIGLLGDDPTLMRKAISYLLRARGKASR